MDDSYPTKSAAWDETRYQEIQARARGSNLDSVTLLATDYLNHFNEIVMLLEMVPDMPEILDDAKEWQPKAYVDHFLTSTIADRELAVEAYPLVPPMYKEPFEQTVGLINALIASTVERLDAEVATGEVERVRESARSLSRNIQRLMDSASAIMHGTTKTLAQSDIDQLMDV